MRLGAFHKHGQGKQGQGLERNPAGQAIPSCLDLPLIRYQNWTWVVSLAELHAFRLHVPGTPFFFRRKSIRTLDWILIYLSAPEFSMKSWKNLIDHNHTFKIISPPKDNWYFVNIKRLIDGCMAIGSLISYVWSLGIDRHITTFSPRPSRYDWPPAHRLPTRNFAKVP
jgi:hypothetical protein